MRFFSWVLVVAVCVLVPGCVDSVPPGSDDLTEAQIEQVSEEVRARTLELVRAAEAPRRASIEPLLATARPVRISIGDVFGDRSRYLGSVERTPADFRQRIEVIDLVVVPLTSSTALAYYDVESQVLSPEEGPLENWRNEVVWFRESDDWRIASFWTVSIDPEEEN